MQLARWLAVQSPATNVLIGGGGTLVESIRELDRSIGIDEVTCHRMALHGMSASSHLLSHWFPLADRIQELGQLKTSDAPLLILDVRPWVLANRLLPETWDLTSDSIAAVVASEVAADELVILKSCLPSEAATDYFDPLFSDYVKTDATRVVNLRSQEFEESRF